MIQAATFGRKESPQAREGDELFLGVNMRLAPDKVPPGFLCALENYRTRSGELEPRKGVTKPGWLNITAPGINSKISPVSNFYGCGVFKDPDGLEWAFIASDGYVARCRPHNSKFTLPMPDGVKVLSPCSFVQAFNKLYCFRGRHLAPLVLNSIDDGFEDLLPHWDSTTVYDAAITATGQIAEDIAYGPFIAVDSITSLGDQATVTTTDPHGYVTGADITIQGANQTGYNGRFNITVTDEVTFRFQFGGASASPGTGTIKCSNQSNYWKAVGSKVTLTSLTRSSTTATATIAAHGFSNGQYVTIAGATPAGFNGTYVISNVATDTFDYTLAADPGSDATGTITAQTSVVLAGQSPESNPEAWQQIYNVLPNADDALYINDRLLVPTAYTPGDTEYDSASTYTKKDFIVATDILDDIHFDFQNEFRINQGSDDEIVALVKYGPDTALVFKGKSWGVLSNISMDLSSLSLDMRNDNYGVCAPRSAVVAGQNVFFPVTKRGIVSIQQNQLGQLRSVDIPFSNDIEGLVKRINWNFASRIRLAYWDDKLFVAAPLDDASVTGGNLVPVDATYDNAGGTSPVATFTVPLTTGATYTMTRGNSTVARTGATDVAEGRFIASGNYITFAGTPDAPVTAEVAPVLSGCNALLVFDFRCGDAGAWQGADTGPAITPMEFFNANCNGLERLFFLARDGYVNMVEEALAGDEIKDTASDMGLSFTPILTGAASRGYRFDSDAQKRFKQMQIVMGAWDAEFTISTSTGAAGSERKSIAGESFDRSTYLRPFNKAPYAPGNADDDFETPGRGNYSVPIPTAGLSLGSGGIHLHWFQEFTRRVSIPKTAGRYMQIAISNAAGRLKIKSITAVAGEGQRRSGRMI